MYGLLSVHTPAPCILQQIRARALAHFERAFQQCDIIITPATPSTAADFHPAVHTSGMYDVAQTFEGVRFTQVCRTTI
jgi:Asp-tRNA(Asn)/Glu-tRNA(Gln) amidotransferase A subunit family amidase